MFWTLMKKKTSLVYRMWRGNTGAPGWLSRLSVWLQLRSWSHGSWVWALSQTLDWQLKAWNLLGILCLPPSLSLPNSWSLSKINKKLFFFFLKRKYKWVTNTWRTIVSCIRKMLGVVTVINTKPLNLPGLHELLMTGFRCKETQNVDLPKVCHSSQHL